MAVTRFQSDILRLLAGHRRALGESYVAGGVAFNLLLDAPRRSHDIDLFHDTQHALSESWRLDRECLESAGYRLEVLREAPAFVEARVIRDGDQTELQWVRDSAFRFFPLIEDDRLGLALHPFDLATNKVLAMAGRLEVRDWVDLLQADVSVQPLGLLVWAACGKDPGYNPASLLAAIRRHHYSQEEVNMLDFDGEPPCAVALGSRWHEALRETASFFDLLPAEQAGTCILKRDGALFTGPLPELDTELAQGSIIFHKGRIRGAWPIVR